VSGACVNLKFPVSQIREKRGMSVSLSIPSATLFPEAVPGAKHRGDAAAALDFSVGGSRILLQGNVAGAWLVACSRCLKEHPAEYEASFEETYPLTAEFIDASAQLREAALLEIPQRSLCRPDCPIPWGEGGLEPGQPEAPKSASPFDALKKLKERN
jgi:uncharacterized metal-binding protein YceD (DUF177 family)